MVDTKTQWAYDVAATALLACDRSRVTSTTASQPPSATAAGGGSARSHGRCVAPSGTGPDAPRQAQVTSQPRATACSATSRDRNRVPPSTRSFMRATPPPRPAPGKGGSLSAQRAAAFVTTGDELRDWTLRKGEKRSVRMAQDSATAASGEPPTTAALLARAQQVADQLVREAREEAARLMRSAEGARDQQVDAARTESDKLRAQAQDDAAALRAESQELRDTAASEKTELLEGARTEAEATLAGAQETAARLVEEARTAGQQHLDSATAE